MATKTMLKNINISDKSKVKKFINALEKSAKNKCEREKIKCASATNNEIKEIL